MTRRPPSHRFLDNAAKFLGEALAVRMDPGPGGMNFLTSKADVWHVQVLGCHQLHIWDLPKVRAWFHAKGPRDWPYSTPNEDYNTTRFVFAAKLLHEQAPDAVEVIQLPFPTGVANGR